MSDRLQRFLEVFDLAARQAGAVARRLQGEVAAREKSGSGSPEAAALSVADFATQDVILHALRSAFSDVAVDAEEETESEGWFPTESENRPVIVVDPVDGSLNYLRGSNDYGVMGGWIEGGRFRAALIHFPVQSVTWGGIADQGCWRISDAGDRCPAELDTGARTVLHSPGVPEDALARLAAAGHPLELTRCSAVETTAPLSGRGRAGLSFGGFDRRRAIGLFLGLSAGAPVLVDGVSWRGEDPGPEMVGPRWSLVAATTEDAATIDTVARSGEPRV